MTAYDVNEDKPTNKAERNGRFSFLSYLAKAVNGAVTPI